MTYDSIKDILTIWDGTQISNPRECAPLLFEIWSLVYRRD